jgi:hypothetical protein
LSGVCGFAYTSYLGVISHRKIFGITWPNMYKTSFGKFMLRFVIIGLISLPFVVPYVISFEAHISILILVKGLVPSLCLGYVIFGWTHFFFKKFGLLNGSVESED